MYLRSVPRVWRERIAKYRLVGGECKACGAKFYPPRSRCPRCGSGDVRDVQLPREGKVVSYTVVRAPPTEFKGLSPYVVALIELKDGTRILSQITDVDPTRVRTGMEVEAVFRRYREQGEEGVIEYGIKFRPKGA